jgi:CubicO group peptidase (beta-lactamase class C family)
VLICVAATGIWVNALLPAASFPAAASGDEGLPAAALRAIADTVQGYCERDIIVGGALVVIKNRHGVWSEAYGWQDRENGSPMRPDTLCNIRSMTKMLTGAACQILIDEGLVRLKDPVAQYLPGFDTARSRAITVEQLLTHRSGLPLSILTSLDEYPTLYAMADAIGQRGPQFTPGSRFWREPTGSNTDN